ncbi:MAG: hypothetical protein U1F67_19695 [Rubrivivax sp.]
MPIRAERRRLADRAGGVAGEQHLDAARDGEAVGFDLPHREPELRRQVHAGDDELQLDARLFA